MPEHPEDREERAEQAPPVRTGGAFVVGAVLRLRKPHACGGQEWTVTRVGADIGLECRTCARRIMLGRDELQRRLKR
jgi:hypothetical protein